MKSLARVCIAVAIASVGLLVLMSGPAPVAEAQTGWSKVALGSEGHDVVLDEARDVLYASLPDARKITVVDAASGIILRDILLADRPVGMDLSPDGEHLYVALFGAGSVAVIDLSDDSVETVSVSAELGSPDTWDVYAIDDNRFLVSGNADGGGLNWIVLVDQSDSSRVRVASDFIIRGGPVFTGNVGDDFVYIGEGFSPNSLYKLDLTQPSMPIAAEDNHGDVSGTQRARVSPDGSRLILPTQIVRTLDLIVVGTTPVEDSFPAPLEDGRVAFVGSLGQTVRVANNANQIVLTRSTPCAFSDSADPRPEVGGITASADSSTLYFEAGGSLCAVSLVPPPCSLATVVTTEDDFNSAIDCFNAQTPAGDHTITLGASFSPTKQLNPVTLNLPGTRLTIAGADNVLTRGDLLCCEALLALEGSADLYLEQLLLDARGDVALTVGAGAGELWVIDAGIVGSVDVEGGTFVLLRSVIRDSIEVGINATGGIVSVYRSFIVDVYAPIVSSADLLAVDYSIINGATSDVAIRARGTQSSDVQITGSVIFDAQHAVVLEGANTSSIISNSTLWDNRVGVSSQGGDVTVTNSTIVLGDSGIIATGGNVSVTSSILSTINDCSEAFNGTNNFSQASDCGAGFTVLTDYDLTRFGTLEDHGCTPAIETPWGCPIALSLLEGHAAIGFGKCDDVQVRYDETGPLEIDQRGVARSATNCDAGAFETPFSAKCNGLNVTINLSTNGGNGAGTSGADVILGTAGDDIIDGRGGNDTICGLDGRDRISGGPGADTVFGGFGIDYIYGDAGDDMLDGQGGSDRMFGGPGNDLMLGDSGADRMFGGDGDDEMRGMGGQDFMWGEAGNDLMQGNFQTDNMWGGPGNDAMFGAGGKDTLFGDAGNDSLSGGNNTDYLNGGDGVDIANGGRGFDKPLIAPQVRAGNGQFFDGSGCIAETILNCQPAP